MIKIFSRVTDSLIRKGYIPEDEREIFLYGFDISFYTIWSTSVLLLTGLFLRQFVASVIIVFVFYTFQSFGGGLHADSHLKCLLTMICGLFFGLSFVFLKERTVLLLAISGIGAFILLFIPLVLHPNKAYLEPERKRLSMRSVIATLVLIVPSLIAGHLFTRFLYAFSAAFLLAAVSRIAGLIKYR